MIKKISDFLAHLPMTIVGGVFLFFSFILPKLGYSWGKYLAWVTVVISGIPLLYLAIIRIIKNKQKIDNTKYKDNPKWQGSGAKETLIRCQWKCKMV